MFARARTPRVIERGLMATGFTARSIAAGFRGLEMHDDVLNARVAGNQCSFHLMTYAMAVADGQGWINFDVQFDEKSSSALSNEAFLDPSDPGLVCGGCAYRLAKLR